CGRGESVRWPRSTASTPRWPRRAATHVARACRRTSSPGCWPQPSQRERASLVLAGGCSGARPLRSSPGSCGRRRWANETSPARTYDVSRSVREVRTRLTARKEACAVSASVLYMSMSLDGFIAGPNEGPDNGLGDGGHRLHDWLMTDGEVDVEAIRRSGGVDGTIVDEFMTTGAVAAGRGPL